MAMDLLVPDYNILLTPYVLSSFNKTKNILTKNVWRTKCSTPVLLVYGKWEHFLFLVNTFIHSFEEKDGQASR